MNITKYSLLKIIFMHMGVIYVKKQLRNTIITTNKPNTFLLGTNTTPEFIAYIFIQRYRYNQSFYKLEKKFKNIGLSITQQTLLNWTNRINKIYFSNKIESFDFFRQMK